MTAPLLFRLDLDEPRLRVLGVRSVPEPVHDQEVRRVGGFSPARGPERDLDRLGDDLGDAPEELGPDQEVAFERRLERDPGLLAESVDAGHAPSGRSDLALLLQVHVVSLRRSAVVAGRGLVRIFHRHFLLLFAAGGRSSRSGAQRSRDAGRRSPINGGADAGWCLSVQDQHSEQVSAGCSCGSAGPLRQSFRLCMVIGTTTEPLAKLPGDWGWAQSSALLVNTICPGSWTGYLVGRTGGTPGGRSRMFRRVLDRALGHPWVTDARRAPRGVAGGALVMSRGARAGRR